MKSLGPGIPANKEFDFGEQLGKVEAKTFPKEHPNASHIDLDVGGSGYLHDPDILQPPGPGISDNKGVRHPELSPAVKLFLRLLGVGIAVFSSIVSGFNSYEWFVSLRPPFLALLMAVTLVGAGIVLPDFAIALWRSRRKLIGTLLFLSGVVAILFCMITTIAALYNTRTSRTEVSYASSVSVADTKATKEHARAALATILQSLASTNELVIQTQAKVDAIPSDETLSVVSQTLMGRLNRYILDRKTYEKKIDELNKVLLEKTPEGSIARTDFYGFLAGIFKLPSESVEFWTGALPAVFLELVAPIMLGVALFL